MGLNALYSNTFTTAFITANETDFDEFIRLSTLASQNLINGIDPSEEEDTLYRMLILLEAIDNPEITTDDEETLRHCLTSIRVKTPTIIENFFSDSFLDTYCSSFTEFLRLMTEASERQINGKDSKSRNDTAGRILLILSALKNSSDMSDDDIESLRYCLLNLNVTLTDRTLAAITTPCVETVDNYSMMASAGLFTLTGQDATFTLAFTLAADYGSFALTGQDVTFESALTMNADVGMFTLTGQDVEFVDSVMFQSKGTKGFDTSDSIAFTYPASITAGEILFLLVNTEGFDTITADGSWSLIASNSFSTSKYKLYYKIAAGTESGTENVTRDGASGELFMAQVYRFSNSFGDATFESAAVDSDTIDGIDFGSVTVAGQGRTLIAFAINVADGDYDGPPSGYTAKASDNSSGTFFNVSTKEQASAGTAATTTGGAFSGWATIHVSVYSSI